MTRPLSVAVAGLGTVGGGVLKLLRDNADIVAAHAGRPIAVTAVSARDRTKAVSYTHLDVYKRQVPKLRVAARVCVCYNRHSSTSKGCP